MNSPAATGSAPCIDSNRFKGQSMALATLIAMLLALAGCSHVSDRVVLLPQNDGRPSAVEVRLGEQRLPLNKPYAVAERKNGQLQPATTTAAEVNARYGNVLAMQPARPQRFVVRFEANGNQLAAESQQAIEQMRAALARLTAPEVIVTGHTDRVGPADANDRLSLVRAQTVRHQLVALGVARESIVVVGRGEREPAVETADEVAEPRNRRVEIKIR